MVELKSKNLIDPAWNKLYRLAFLKQNGMQFPEGEIYEDTHFNLHLLERKPTISVNSRCFYHYVLHMGSITRRFNPEKLPTIKKRALLLKSATKGIDEYCDYYYIKSVFSSLIDMFLSCGKDEILSAVKSEVKEPYFKSAAANARFGGMGAKIVVFAAKSGPLIAYLFCKASYILKYKMQKLFLKVR